MIISPSVNASVKKYIPLFLEYTREREWKQTVFQDTFGDLKVKINQEDTFS